MHRVYSIPHHYAIAGRTRPFGSIVRRGSGAPAIQHASRPGGMSRKIQRDRAIILIGTKVIEAKVVNAWLFAFETSAYDPPSSSALRPRPPLARAGRRKGVLLLSRVAGVLRRQPAKSDHIPSC